MMVSMAPAQSPDQIQSILERLHGRKVAILRILGINSLKSVDPPPGALAGMTITSSDTSDRTFRLLTEDHEVTIDLQRTGKVVWLDTVQPYQLVVGATYPTVRLVLSDGSGVDLTEPAKTKRITVALARRGG